MSTLAHQLENLLNVDVDTLDPEVAKAMPFTPHDVTSNHLIVGSEMLRPDNADMVKKIVEEHKAEGWETIMDYITAGLGAKALKNISGRVLAQVSPRYAYNTEEVIRQARSYAKAYASFGVDTDHFCIKIASTGPALNASKTLKKDGIRTLGTSLFSLPQAIACSQAECLYISPYYNEVKAHAIPDQLWPNVKDPAVEHPMSYRMYQIHQAYRTLGQKTGKPQPLIKAASFISKEETFACAELGAHSATISDIVLLQLRTNPATPEHETASKRDSTNVEPSPRLASLAEKDVIIGDKFKPFSVDTDYLSNSGAALDQAIKDDPETAKRLKEALELFNGAEVEARAQIEKWMAQY